MVIKIHETGTTDAGGYIWHTTDSGKTLTSFKTAQLVKGLPGIEIENWV
jgi:type I restriction enzyme R subunit